MSPDFSEEEYRRLMVLAYLGEWMINAIRKDTELAYEDAVSKVYASAKGTGLEPLVAFDENQEAWIPSESFESEVQALIDQYDDKTFWEELTARLTERDLIVRHGERAVRGMRPDQRVRSASALAKTYTKEFEERGLDRLTLDLKK